MPKKLTHEQFLKRLSINNEGVSLVEGEKYFDQYTKILVKCSVGGHPICLATPKSLMNGRNPCRICDNLRKQKLFSLGRDNVNSRLRDKKSLFRISPDEKYINQYTKINFTCVIHGITVNAVPKEVVNGSVNCPICYSEKRHKLLNSKLTNNSKLSLVKGQKLVRLECKYLFKCKNPDHKVLNLTLRQVVEGYECPQCKNPKSNSKLNKSTYIYYTKTTGLFKVGITGRNPKTRLSELDQKAILIDVLYLPIRNQARELEKYILNKYADKLIFDKTLVRSGATETFIEDVIISLADEYTEYLKTLVCDENQQLHNSTLADLCFSYV